MLKLFKNSKGFTLVEIMIASGLMAGLALIVMNITSQGTKNAKRISQDVEVVNIVSDIMGVLKDRNSCAATLRGSIVSTNALAAAVTLEKRDTSYAGGMATVTPAHTGVDATIYNAADRAAIIRETAPNDGTTHSSATTRVATHVVGTRYALGNQGTMTLDDLALYDYAAGPNATVKLRVRFRISPKAVGTGTGEDIARNVYITRSINLRINKVSAATTFDDVDDPEADVDSCYTDESFYRDAACRSLGGEPASNGECESLDVKRTNKAAPHTDTIAALEGTKADRALTLNGDLAILDSAGDTGSFYVSGESALRGATTMGATAHIVGAATLDNTLTVTGATTLNNTLSVVGPNATTLGGTLNVTGATSLGNTLNVTGATTLNNTLSVVGANATTLGGTLNVTGATTLNNTLNVSGVHTASEFIILNKTAAQLGPPGVAGTDKYVVNKEWVWSTLTGYSANQLSAAQKEAIVSYVLQSTTNDNYTKIKADITSHTLASISAIGQCSSGYYTQYVTYSNGVINHSCGLLPPASPNCTLWPSPCDSVYANDMVYAGNRFCLAGNNCITAGKIAFWGQCYWASHLGYGAYADASTSLVNWMCPPNWFAAGIRTNTFPEPWCCPAKILR